MLKPRLRIPRRPGLLRPSSASAPQCPTPFAVAVAVAAPRQQQQRSIHATPRMRTQTLPLLRDHELFNEKGIGRLYTPQGFNAAYNMYGSWCLERLNTLTQGTPLEGRKTKDIAILTSREPSQAATFNFASMAHNNHFYFDSLSASGGQDVKEHMTEQLKAELMGSFDSIETLQRELLLTADAMFGPGFVWLVKQSDATGPLRFPYKILVTYQAGSPYPHAHWRRQFRDMNNEAGITDRAGQVVNEYFNRQNVNNRRAPVHGDAEKLEDVADLLSSPANKNPGGTDVVPVLCVNTWEHAWMWDFGIGGKLNFLSAWWDHINWSKVAERASVVGERRMKANPRLEYNSGTGAF